MAKILEVRVKFHLRIADVAIENEIKTSIIGTEPITIQCVSIKMCQPWQAEVLTNTDKF